MSTDTRNLELQLPRRSIFNLADASGVQIVCRAGSVWITLDNDPRDIVLQAGESYTGTDHRQAIIYALDASQLVLTDSETVARPRTLPTSARARTRTLAQASA